MKHNASHNRWIKQRSKELKKGPTWQEQNRKKAKERTSKIRTNKALSKPIEDEQFGCDNLEKDIREENETASSYLKKYAARLVSSMPSLKKSHTPSEVLSFPSKDEISDDEASDDEALSDHEILSDVMSDENIDSEDDIGSIGSQDFSELDDENGLSLDQLDSEQNFEDSDDNEAEALDDLPLGALELASQSISSYSNPENGELALLIVQTLSDAGVQADMSDEDLFEYIETIYKGSKQNIEKSFDFISKGSLEGNLAESYRATAIVPLLLTLKVWKGFAENLLLALSSKPLPIGSVKILPEVLCSIVESETPDLRFASYMWLQRFRDDELEKNKLDKVFSIAGTMYRSFLTSIVEFSMSSQRSQQLTANFIVEFVSTDMALLNTFTIRILQHLAGMHRLAVQARGAKATLLPSARRYAYHSYGPRHVQGVRLVCQLLKRANELYPAGPQRNLISTVYNLVDVSTRSVVLNSQFLPYCLHQLYSLSQLMETTGLYIPLSSQLMQIGQRLSTLKTNDSGKFQHPLERSRLVLPISPLTANKLVQLWTLVSIHYFSNLAQAPCWPELWLGVRGDMMKLKASHPGIKPLIQRSAKRMLEVLQTDADAAALNREKITRSQTKTLFALSPGESSNMCKRMIEAHTREAKEIADKGDAETVELKTIQRRLRAANIRHKSGATDPEIATLIRGDSEKRTALQLLSKPKKKAGRTEKRAKKRATMAISSCSVYSTGGDTMQPFI